MDIKKYYKVSESLRKYQRADLAEFQSDLGESPVDKIYVDLLPNDGVISSVVSGNTTFLLGRKGTGKSTVFAKAQSLIRTDSKDVILNEEIKAVHQALIHPIPIRCSSVLNSSPAKWLAYQEHFDLLEQIMMQERSPVCLKCGGVNHQEIKFPEVLEGERLTDIAEATLGINHPVCGGELYVEGSGCMRLGVTPKTHYFDLRGKYLTTLHGRDGHISF
ncbi:MAG: hypothetical protein NWS71_08795 [Opitutales bacterium]|jgi:energy-coupling factor transporter ATP-binding protein EcfA2|nr:hypothetical protein [Opitutales bacterium]